MECSARARLVHSSNGTCHLRMKRKTVHWPSIVSPIMVQVTHTHFTLAKWTAHSHLS